MKENPKPSTSAEFDDFSHAYNTHMQHPLRDFASGQDDAIFPEHKSDYLARLIKRLFNNKSSLNLLDFGCGNGSLLKWLSKRIQSDFQLGLFGVDISSGMIREAKKAWGDQKAVAQFDNLLQGKTSCESESFDIVIASSVFHHIERAQRSDVLKEILRVLKPGGYFLMIEHNPFNPVTKYIVKQTPMDINAILLNPFEAKKLVQNNGFIHVKNDYILFFPPKLRNLWLVEHYIKWVLLGGQYVSINRKSL